MLDDAPKHAPLRGQERQLRRVPGQKCRYRRRLYRRDSEGVDRFRVVDYGKLPLVFGLLAAFAMHSPTLRTIRSASTSRVITLSRKISRYASSPKAAS